MTKPTDSNMTEPNGGQLTDCQKQIEPAMAELRKTLDHPACPTDATPAQERESLEADICLATRSAYFDYYTWLVLRGVTDGPAEEELDQLFRRALSVMLPGKFKDSVQLRYDEFKHKCQRVREGSMESERASSF